MESGTSPKTDPTKVGQKTVVVGKESTGAGPAQATASAGATTSTKPTTTTASPLSRRSQEAGSGVSGRTRPPPLHVSVQVTGSGEPGSQAACSSATLGVHTPSTPRIDISRASSSSHHDSRDSSPENVFEQVGTGTLQEAIGLGFREEGALELRSSTEELYFMDPEQKKEEQEKLQQARKSPVIFKFDEHQTYLQQHQRKDSASSEVAALLCISGRTSRISSVGSQGSAVSRLSAVSGVSRSPSPHRMLLETSFCGPKPLENVIDGSNVSSVEPPTAEALEQALLSRKHDPTQAVFAEGIKIESSPKKQLTNGQKKSKTLAAEKPVEKRIVKPASATSSSAASKSLARQGLTIPKKDAAKPIVGVTPSGTQYIRIKLKPDHMYQDKGLAPNERVVEAAASGSQKKPASLSLGREITTAEQRLTPSSSPKPARHQALAREVSGSRSPSPATVAMSRKSSFCSLFKAKDSPDSPRDRSRSRSKSRDRSTPQSQTGTPNKQKSVLAIFKPKRSGSKSKSSSPIDQDTIAQLDGISQVEFKFKSDQPETKSRPSSRLKYYDTPLDGKSIHIPLHTPPDEKESKGFVSARAKESEAISNLPTANPDPKPGPSSALHSGESSSVSYAGPAPALPQKSPKPLQVEKLQRIENLDAIHSLPQEMDDRERTWSLEVQRHSSQDSQETMSLESSLPSSRRISKPNLSDVIESPVKENGILPPPKAQTVTTQQSQQQILQHQQVHAVVQPSQPIQTPTGIQPSVPTSREKRRLMFATRIGSGSEEQIFSTQFSLSKTESLSSQLSEQTSIPDSPAVDGREQLHRSDTVIRRPDEATGTQTGVGKRPSKQSSEESGPPEICRAVELEGCAAIPKKDSSDDIKRKSKSTSEDDEKRPSAIVTMRKKDSSEEGKRKSKSNSEEDDPTHRHSKYLENFDVRKKFPESKRQSSRNSSDSSIKERDSRTSSHEDGDNNLPATTAAATSSKQTKQRLHHTSPNPCHLQPQQQSERQSIVSTDEPAESSESERDSEMESTRIKRHLPRHIGAIEDHESTGLVSQDSFEDELPYVPTTLPEERAHGVSLIPMKERINMELKTCPVDRPRSTTPMNPACLEEYCGIVTPDDTDHTPVRGEKLRISLPRKDSTKEKAQKTKSPRQLANTSGKSWFEFAEQGIRGTTTTTSAGTPTQVTSERERRGSSQDEEPPPPLPPRKPSQPSGQWINFENIPEKRKPPKRITALPKDSLQEPKSSMQPPIQYNYVKPEECQCECHEVERESGVHKSIASVDLLQQGEDTQPLLESESQEGIDPSDSSVDYSYGADIPETAEQKPFEMDLSLGLPGSNRSSLHSQDPESPDRQPTTNDSTISKGRQRPSDYRNP